MNTGKRSVEEGLMRAPSRVRGGGGGGGGPASLGGAALVAVQVGQHPAGGHHEAEEGHHERRSLLLRGRAHVSRLPRARTAPSTLTPSRGTRCWSEPAGQQAAQVLSCLKTRTGPWSGGSLDPCSPFRAGSEEAALLPWFPPGTDWALPCPRSGARWGLILLALTPRGLRWSSGLHFLAHDLGP